MPTSAQTTSPMLNSTSNNPTTWHHQLFQRQALRLQQCISDQEAFVESGSTDFDLDEIQEGLSYNRQALDNLQQWLKDN